MQARQLPAGRGWSWITEGFAIFRRNPPFVTFLVFSYWFLLAAINVFPLIGQAIASLVMPALSVSVANGCRAIERGSPAAFELLFSGFRSNLRSLVRLGAIYLLVTLAVFGVSFLADDGRLLNAMNKGPEALMEALKQPGSFVSLQIMLVLFTPVVMAFWFAPLLAAWTGMQAGKSLFFSFFACLRNWKAFMVYGAGVMMISAALPGVVLGLLSAIAGGALGMLSIAIILALIFVFLPTLFASFYVSARDIFVELGTPGQNDDRTG